MLPRWPAGSPVVYREILNGRIWTARPVTVIQDAPGQVAVYLTHGAKWQRFVPLQPGISALQCKTDRAEWRLKEAEWEFGGTVLLLSETEAHAIHVMWNTAGEFMGWYVNLQEPLRRNRLGFETLDEELDLVVDTNGAWRWKDEDHLAEAEALGLYSAAKVRAIRAEGKRVVEKIEARSAPFDGSWTEWLAPHDWEVPTLPAGWDRLDSGDSGGQMPHPPK
jgi:hypothetical protein